VGKQVLILGGGFGGLSAAHTLRKGLGLEHRITIVDKQPTFQMGLTKLWILNNTKHTGEITGNRTALVKYGMNFLEGEVSAIDIANREVRVGKQQLKYDYLIVALGADYSPTSTPGFAKYAKNLYNESGCAEIRDILNSFQSGTITILVCGLPFKCPPAPYEASMIIDDVLRKKGVRDKVKIQIVTPEPHPLTILGPDAGKAVVTLLEERGIEYHPAQKVIDIRRNSVATESKEVPHDLVLAIPTHVAPSILKESGLLDPTGWIRVDPETLVTGAPNVFAIGDCAGPKTPMGPMLPRAGVLAEEQGRVVASNIVQEILGEGKLERFGGEGVCFMEVGDGKAAPLHAGFYAQPAPKWEFTSPSAEGYQAKHRFLAERMKAWFG